MSGPDTGGPDPRSGSAYLMDIVRRADRPRYVATLFAPSSARDDLFALYAFAAEIERIPDAVSEAGLGEIRLAWWRERLDAGGAEGEGSPVLSALFAAIARRRLPVAPLIALVEARSADLYGDPPADIAALEAYFGETESVLFQLAGLILGATGLDIAEASGHAGIAYGLARRLARFGHDRQRGRSVVPSSILAEHGLTAADLFEPTARVRLQSVVAGMAAIASGHLAKARHALGGAPSICRPAFLPLAVVGATLRRITDLGAGIFERPALSPELSVMARIGLAAMRRRAP